MTDLNLNKDKWLRINLKAKEKRIIGIFQLLRKFEIEPILIKGRAASEFYPYKHQRVSIDTDVCVSPEKYDQAEEILMENSNLLGLVDLHNGLRELDTLEWNDLFDNSIFIEINEIKIRVLRPEDHLRVLCIHWLTDGGEYKERLTDIFWLVKNRPDNFDWERCLNRVDQNRRRWIICVIGIAHKYLNLEIDDLPFSNEAKNLPKWLTKAVEKEWKTNLRLVPLSATLKDPKSLFRQIRKRTPPNPITSTVMVGGSFDSRTRIGYQIISFYRRFLSSVKRNYR